jgi:hypothetical protein
MKRFALVVMCALAVTTASSGAGKGVTEWNMWGGSPDRNMVSDATGLPTTWDVKTGQNIKWVAALGSQSYGIPWSPAWCSWAPTMSHAIQNRRRSGVDGVS